MEKIENRKIRLCFGTFFNVLSQCTIKKCNKTTLLETLLKIIDPKANVIGEKYRQYNHIYKCETNFSTLLSDGILSFSDIDKDNVTQEFQKHVIPLIDIDKLTPLVLSICDIIKEDATLSYENNGENIEKFQKYIGKDIENFLNSKEYYLTNFLTDIFLYTVIEIDNRSGLEWIKDIKKDKNYTKYFNNFVDKNNSKKNTITVYITYMQTKANY